jgi:hypothetical protein
MKHWSLFHSGEVPGKPVLVEITQGPWYLVLADPLFWLSTKGCDILHKMKLPRFIREMKIKPDEDEEECTYEDYYGPDAAWIWHIYVEGTILKLASKAQANPKLKSMRFSMTLEEGEAVFGKEEIAWIRKHEEDRLQEAGTTEETTSQPE